MQKKFTLGWHQDACFYPIMSTGDKIELAKACSTLTEININDYKFSTREAIRFLSKCTFLKLCRFQLSARSKYNEFVNSLSGEWQASIKGNIVKVKRVAEAVSQNESESEDLTDSEISFEDGLYCGSTQSIESSSDVSMCETLSEASDIDTDIDTDTDTGTDTEANESERSEQSECTDVSDARLMHMQFNDLLEAADLNAQSRSTIDSVLLAKYQVDSVKFSLSYEQAIEQKNDTIFIGDETVYLNFLHCYGHIIKTIHLDFTMNFNGDLLQHLNEYCADSLIELQIHGGEEEITNRKFKKTFSKVEVLKFNNCILSSRLSDFNRWSPQMKSLNFVNETILSDNECIVMPFPHMEHLTIELQTTSTDDEANVDVNRHSFHVECVKKTLRLNSQLRSIALYNLDVKFLRNISEHLRLLDKLEIRWSKHWKSSTDLEDSKIHFKSVQELEVAFHPDDANAQAIPLSFDRLKTLKLEAKELNYNLFEFINRHATITKLILINDKLQSTIQTTLN